ncbi:hypothetical protein K461DRAFT_41421 [Myriangium duriaei CBS 260.36]|uniref:Zn(2)-C6 fungal-type domain-containing protein n=1 Tax=Myriangium duriaei CBS 260.36 TaxID=1168546 RepID=A0A9P4MHP3_9PEZI|nr:hypothetical protein K461DRAFT_41421 [Myriangium duriaei CBS 260.36]
MELITAISDTSERNSRPLRPGQACLMCKHRKTKCDIDRPCQACIIRGSLCQNQDLTQPPPQKSSERAGSRNHRAVEDDASDTELSFVDIIEISDGSTQSFRPSTQPSQSHDCNRSNPNGHLVRTSCMAASGASTLPSAAVSSQRLATEFENRERQETSTSYGSSLFATTRSEDMVPLDRLERQQRLRDSLVQEYFHSSWPLFPILDRQSFEEAHQNRWSPDSNHCRAEDPHNFTVMELVYAIGCKHSSNLPNDDNKTRTQIAEEFYGHACNSIELVDLIRNPAISAVQVLLLMVVYQQTRRYVKCCNILHSTAIPMAQAIGLHLENPRVEHDPRAMNLRRCIWHCCVSLHRLNCLAYGYPIIDYAASSNTPLPELTAFNPWGPHYMKSLYPPLGLFISSCRLFDILADVLRVMMVINLRSGNEGQNFWERRETDLTKICNRLDNVRNDVPQGQTDDRTLLLQQRVFRYRRQLVRLLACQPLLMISIPPKVNSADSQPSHSNPAIYSSDDLGYFCNSCVEAAIKLVKEFWYHISAGGAPNQPEAWFATYYAFTAGAVFLVSNQSPLVKTEGKFEKERTWSRCLEVLRFYSKETPMAIKAIEILKAIDHGIEKISNSSQRALRGTNVDVHPRSYPSWLFGTSFNIYEQYLPDDGAMSDFDWMHDWLF